MKKFSLFACLCLWLGFSHSVSAEPVTLTFNELPTQPVSTPTTDLSFRGVTFRFRVGGQPSPDARYNAAGPGNFTFIQGAILEGDAHGTLTLDFNIPTTRLMFGAARSSLGTLTPGITVELFDPAGGSLGVIAVNTSNLSGISEGLFNYPGGALVSRAVIAFNDPTAASRFALDNLTFEPVPEPATLLLLSTGLAAAGMAARRGRKKRQTSDR
jgi:hypothetical protein